MLAANKGAYGDLDADLVDKWRPVGLHNIKYVLKRNAVPNGKYVSVKYLRSSSSSLSKVGKYIFNTTTDVTTDLFQLGRSSSAANAIVVKGPQWLGKKSQNVGPVSRYACRIVVDRLSPYRARVYAGGLDDRGDFCISENATGVHLKAILKNKQKRRTRNLNLRHKANHKKNAFVENQSLSL